MHGTTRWQARRWRAIHRYRPDDLFWNTVGVCLMSLKICLNLLYHPLAHLRHGVISAIFFKRSACIWPGECDALLPHKLFHQINQRLCPALTDNLFSLTTTHQCIPLYRTQRFIEIFRELHSHEFISFCDSPQLLLRWPCCWATAGCLLTRICGCHTAWHQCLPTALSQPFKSVGK